MHGPDGLSLAIVSTQVQGSTTPDYNSFCFDCYANADRVALEAIDWSVSSRAQHGHIDGTGTAGNIRLAPYTLNGTSGNAEDTASNFVMSCLDCHEPYVRRQ